MKKCLDIGSGMYPYKEDGYKVINTDIERYKKEYEILDLNKRFPFKNNEFDKVRCYNALEQARDLVFTRDEIYRVLKKGGIFKLRMMHFSNPNWCLFHNARNYAHSYLFTIYPYGKDRNQRFHGKFKLINMDFEFIGRFKLKLLKRIIKPFFRYYEQWLCYKLIPIGQLTLTFKKIK